MIDLAELFTWSDKTSLISEAQRTDKMFLSHQMEKIMCALNEHANYLSKNSKLAEGVECFFSLDELAMKKIISAPEMCFRLANYSDKPSELFSFLSNCSKLEAVHHQNDKPYGGWSVLGDRYEPNSIEFKDIHNADDWLDNKKQQYTAKKTKEGFVIDVRSPYAKRKINANNFRPNFSSPIKIENKETQKIDQKIIEGSSFLNQHCSSALPFPKTFIKTLMPRVDGAISGYQGSSSRVHMGRVNLLNPDIEQINAHNIASSLVHESIHIYLYILETWQSPSEHYDELYSPNRISPWTKQPLHLHAFIHAAFVWWGLKSLWDNIEENGGIKSHVGKYYQQTAELGFKSKEYTTLLKDTQQFIEPSLLEQLYAVVERF